MMDERVSGEWGGSRDGKGKEAEGGKREGIGHKTFYNEVKLY